eukprot:CAMPEP_0183759340 /NCGR_PEP_ID=MMETSP0739-20130205/7034_1 /TAXON_ID=385413 /ORGANISM="Thalassiosira miniscula, Strain CCMP1093" /LENGTH=38 /DNA_ID= /DNA_START= /DNA_END= /DNA_ORIENTATION=
MAIHNISDSGIATTSKMIFDESFEESVPDCSTMTTDTA